MYGTPGKLRSPRSPNGYGTPSHRAQQPVDDTPIQNLCQLIESTPVDQWNKRTAAFQSLVASIPKLSTDGSDEHDHGKYWYNSRKALRHLAPPLTALLKDARSTVVKRTCEACKELFQRCGVEARYLLKDLMPTVMAVHAQTVQVIRVYVQHMVTDALLHVPCKAAMPIWLDRLKMDKSRTVREACAAYLVVGLEAWTNEPDYLTTDIWTQVGNVMLRSLRDPSPDVREYIKEGLAIVRNVHPDLWEKMMTDPDGPATRDPKLKRFLSKIGTDDMDELSVASRGSAASRGSLASMASNRSTRTAPRSARGLGPPLRVATSRSAPAHHPVPVVESPLQNSSGDRKTSPPTSLDMPVFAVGETNRAAVASHQVHDASFLVGVQELKKQASEKRSRRSSIMKDRWSRSNSSLGDQKPPETAAAAATVVVEDEPEHIDIARKLLAAHRIAVDGLMEMIRLEMDTLEDFETICRAPNRPTEDDVLIYFEALSLCLDKRGKLSKQLQEALDGVSGE